MLKRLVEVLEAACGPDDYVVRVGGDEFVMLLLGEDASQRTNRVSGALDRRHEKRPDAPELASVSIGVGRVPPGLEVSLRDAYALADQALQTAKAKGPGSVVEMSAARKDKNDEVTLAAT